MTTKTDDRKFLTPNGPVDRAGYVKYLRECATRWRFAQAFDEKEKMANAEQARRVEAKADLIERGEEDR